MALRIKYIRFILFTCLGLHFMLFLKTETDRSIKSKHKVIEVPSYVIGKNIAEPENKIWKYHQRWGDLEFENVKHGKGIIENAKNTVIYILLWSPETSPLSSSSLKEGRATFIENKCKYSNCYLTSNRSFFSDVTAFDAVLFGSHGTAKGVMPSVKSPKQKYIFASLESASYYPTLTKEVQNGIFDLTWTYRLDSDILWRYVKVLNVNGTEIGPALNMKWPILGDVTESVKRQLRTKKKLAVWTTSHCRTIGRREFYASNLDDELDQYGFEVDVFGACGNDVCGKNIECLEKLKKEYYFYLAFENSIDDDYVTEKIVTALNNLMIPVVFGGADYSRFMPPGSYLDARKLGFEILAQRMVQIYNDNSLHESFFRWTSHIKFVNTEKADICNLCAVLNNNTIKSRNSIYKNFVEWWYGTEVRSKLNDFLLSIFLMDKKLLKAVNEYNYTYESKNNVYNLLNRHKEAYALLGLQKPPKTPERIAPDIILPKIFLKYLSKPTRPRLNKS